MWTRFWKDVLDHMHAAFRFVTFAAKKWGCMGKEALWFLILLGDMAVNMGAVSMVYLHLGDAPAAGAGVGAEGRCGGGRPEWPASGHLL